MTEWAVPDVPEADDVSEVADVPYCTTDVADSFVVHVTVAVVPEPVAETLLTTGGVVSAVANDAGDTFVAGDVLLLLEPSADVTR
jgi:hypothetical protein